MAPTYRLFLPDLKPVSAPCIPLKKQGKKLRAQARKTTTEVRQPCFGNVASGNTYMSSDLGAIWAYVLPVPHALGIYTGLQYLFHNSSGYSV